MNRTEELSVVAFTKYAWSFSTSAIFNRNVSYSGNYASFNSGYTTLRTFKINRGASIDNNVSTLTISLILFHSIRGGYFHHTIRSLYTVK